jgi:hypothetical protein
MMGDLHVEGVDESGSHWEAAWSNVPDELADQVCAFIERTCGRPDTVS